MVFFLTAGSILSSLCLPSHPTATHQLYKPLAHPLCSRMPTIQYLSTNPRFPPFKLLLFGGDNLLIFRVASCFREHHKIRARSPWACKRTSTGSTRSRLEDEQRARGRDAGRIGQRSRQADEMIEGIKGGHVYNHSSVPGSCFF